MSPKLRNDEFENILQLITYYAGEWKMRRPYGKESNDGSVGILLNLVTLAAEVRCLATNQLTTSSAVRPPVLRLIKY